MEKPSKHGTPSRKEQGTSSKVAGDGGKKTSNPRSKLKDKKPPPAERRYKDMLHTTSHIYQPQSASGLSDSADGSRLSNQSTQTLPVREGRSFSTGGVLPEEITADVPLTEIMSRDQPPSAVINSENSFESSHHLDKKSNNIVPAAEENSVIENNLLNHEDQNPTACGKHTSAHTDSKQKSPISRPKLCDSCTVSMLSYIAMLRDMLDEVTNEITNPDNQSIQCAECVKERVIERNQVRTSAHTEHASRKDVAQRPHDLPLSEQQTHDQFHIGDHSSLSKGGPEIDGMRQSYQQPTQIDERAVPGTSSRNAQDIHISHSSRDVQDMPTSELVLENLLDYVQPENSHSEQVDYAKRTDDTKADIPISQSDSTKWTDVFSDESRTADGISQIGNGGQVPREYRGEAGSRVLDHSESPAYVSDQSRSFFGDTFKGSGVAPSSHPAASDQGSWQHEPSGDGRSQEMMPSAPVPGDFHSPASPFLRDREEADGILSALSNEEREVYDSARGRAGWERLTDSQDYRDTSLGPSSTEEAFVTMATTNSEAISCLVLGSSLLLCRTTRTLCVLITDGVSPSLRAPLASVFQVVQSIRSLDTVGTTKVALLDQPDLGIFFRKLHVWRLVQFTKCVFLNPDTLVIQNVDELFCHEELSAVPDIGWPDCFNSGVFVFQPAVETFWKLVEFAESEGSYDGGDQGLLNAFFKTWSKDIHKKLSFIYNLMANVSYTYTPAFKQFGRNVKIVQFQGAFKPWHVKFYTETGQISPSTAVHPTYVQFVHVWLNIFRVRVLPLFSQDIQSFASSRNMISASELLKFYPSPIEIEADFLLTPPSVRIRPDSSGIPKQPSIVRRHSIGTAKELKRGDLQPSSESGVEQPSNDKASDSLPGDVSNRQDDDSRVSEENAPTLSVEVPQVSEEMSSAPPETEANKIGTPAEGSEDDGSRRSSIPGSEIGDYHGMVAWEQGRMDYMGSACSENIIKRLHFLMDKPNDSEKPE